MSVADEEFEIQEELDMEEHWEDQYELENPMEFKNDKSKPIKIDSKCCTDAAKQVKMRNRRIAVFG